DGRGEEGRGRCRYRQDSRGGYPGLRGGRTGSDSRVRHACRGLVSAAEGGRLHPPDPGRGLLDPDGGGQTGRMSTKAHQMTSPATLAEWLTDARRRTLDLVADLPEDALLGPRLETVNPGLWEIGHRAGFCERWVLRPGGGRPSLRADADRLYDSSAVPHATRWDLPLPSLADTLRYLGQIQEGILGVIDRGPTPDET